MVKISLYASYKAKSNYLKDETYYNVEYQDIIYKENE